MTYSFHTFSSSSSSDGDYGQVWSSQHSPYHPYGNYQQQFAVKKGKKTGSAAGLGGAVVVGHSDAANHGKPPTGDPYGKSPQQHCRNTFHFSHYQSQQNQLPPPPYAPGYYTSTETGTGAGLHHNDHQCEGGGEPGGSSFPPVACGIPSTVFASSPPVAMMATALDVASGVDAAAYRQQLHGRLGAAKTLGISLQLSVKAAGLKNIEKGLSGTSDPVAVLTLLSERGFGDPVVIGRTEVIRNTLSPIWTRIFTLPLGVTFFLGRPMHVAVAVFDDNRQKRDRRMGQTVFELGEVMGKPGNMMGKRLRQGGTVYLQVERAMTGQEGAGNASTGLVAKAAWGYLTLRLHGLKLRNVERGFGRSDPFFEISRATSIAASGTTGWNNVYRSTYISNSLNPAWREARIGLDILCNGDLDRQIKIDIYDHNKSGKHKIMGSVDSFLTVRDLSRLSSGSTLELTHWGKNVGTLVVERASLDLTIPPSRMHFSGNHTQPVVADLSHGGSGRSTPGRIPAPFVPVQQGQAGAALGIVTGRPTFVDYLSGGCEINLAVAIDFTGSNGDPRVPGTLHHITRDGSQNDYEMAIDAIGSILAAYDSNQNFPVFGFGAKHAGVLQNCFQVGPAKEVCGVNGILNAYRQVFSSGLVMSGPTVFKEVIRTAAAQARSAQGYAREKGRQVYTVLLILTDGAVSDVMETKRALQVAGDAPLSVVIVGVGGADFGAMRFLDADCDGGDSHASCVGSSKGRDIVQFVQFNDHRHDRNSLTAATLEEIPGQLVDYFYNRHILPGPKMNMSGCNVYVSDYVSQDEIDLSLNFVGNGEEEIIVAGDGNYNCDTVW